MSTANHQINLRNTMRDSLIYALAWKDIAPERIQLPNTPFKKPASGIWIRESFNEGSIEAFSNVADHEFIVVNYEIFGKAGMGTDEVDEIVYMIENAFMVGKRFYFGFSPSGYNAVVKRIDKPTGGIDNAEPAWYRRLVAITLELYKSRNWKI